MRLMVSLLTFGPSWMSANCNTRNLPDWWNCRRPSRADTESGRRSPSSAGWMRGRVALAACCNSVILLGECNIGRLHVRFTQGVSRLRCHIASGKIHQPTAQSDVNRQVRKTKNPRICEGSLAGMPGLEPRMAEPESAVLPITPHPNLAGVATSKSCPSYPRPDLNRCWRRERA